MTTTTDLAFDAGNVRSRVAQTYEGPGTGAASAWRFLEDEAFKLIDELYTHATQSKFEYRHKWRSGDMVIWDNRSVMHQANADYDPSEYRFLYRIMLQGAPLQAATV